MAFNPLTIDTADLQRQLQTTNITSVQIVNEYLAQIDRHESALNAFISIAPREILLKTAERLDEERQTGRVRSPLHGIPIVLKDCFITSQNLGLGTTAGSWAFVGAKAKSNSPIVQRLVDAGMIILGKTNMTEFAGMKMTMMMPGWSAYGGQTLSPYVGKIEEGETILGHSAPGGSSTGSAVAVAAGFSPLAMGAETIGSIITPASRAALYALKPTVGMQDISGMYSLTEFFDSPGPMAKSSGDLITLTEILLGKSYQSARAGTWDGLSVGFLDPRVWRTGEEMVCRHHEGTAEQMVEDYEAMVSRLGEKGCFLKYPVELEETTALTVDGEPAIMPIAYWEFKNVCIPRFLESFELVAVHSLEDIVKFNEANKEKCLPEPFTEQNDLLKALYNNDQHEHIEQLKKELRLVAKKILDQVFDQENVNIIAGPADSPLCVHAAAAGYPVGTVPMSQLRYNGRPFGLCVVANENDEEALLRFMCVYESSSGPRAVPKLEFTGSG